MSWPWSCPVNPQPTPVCSTAVYCSINVWRVTFFFIINYLRLTLTVLNINEKCLRTKAMCLLGACPGLPGIEFWTCGLISLGV